MNKKILISTSILLLTLFSTACSEKVMFSFIGEPSVQTKEELDPGESIPIIDDPSVIPVPPVFSMNKMDILIVVDTSLSLRSDRWTLGNKMKSLLSHLNGVDWQLAVVSTGQGNSSHLYGSLIGEKQILKPNTSHLERDFEHLISFDQCNDDSNDGWMNFPCTLGDEQTLKATKAALSLKSNSHFFRNDSELAVIIITDEDEKSVNGTETTPNDVIATFQKQSPGLKNMKVFGIIIEPGDEDCLNEQSNTFADRGAEYGHSIHELAMLTGGSTTSLCGANFSHVFRDITAINL